MALADFKSVDVAAPPGQVGSIPTRFRQTRMRKKGATGAAGTFERIYAVVSRIPRGRVATYGQIARLANLSGRARLVGYALNALDGRRRIPWHRVINAEGRISARSGEGEWSVIQKLRLQREGVAFSKGGVVSLVRFRWRPRGAAGPVTRRVR